MSSKISLSDVSLGEEEKAAVARVIDSGWISMGPETKEFEGEFAALHGTKHAVAVTNGTAALHLAAMALDLGPGDEVIVPSLTFVASANGFAYTGATIRFADIVSDEDPTLDPASVAAAITPRTKAIVPVHYAGWLADTVALNALATQAGAQVVEDACHAVGATGAHGSAGNLGAMGCFSFFPNKNMTVGEGGMVTTNSDELDAALRLLRSHGMTSSSWDRDKGHAYEYDVVRRGYNYRTDEIRSAIGRVQLAKLPGANAHRRQVVAWYRERLRDVPVTVPFLDRADSATSAHVFTVTTRTKEERDRLNTKLREADVQTSRHYPPSHLFSIYREAAAASGSMARTESYAERVITLPLHPKMTVDQVDRVCDLIRKEVGPDRPCVRRSSRTDGSTPSKQEA